jgi:cytochrome P450
LKMAAINFGAGHDTISATLMAVFAHLGRNNAAYNHLLAELETAHLSNPIQYEQVVGLPYLQACTKEAMRLTPITGTTLPRVVPADNTDLVISKYNIPPGTTIGACPYTVHRDPDVFGTDANEFNPDRWIVASKDRQHEMERSMLIFGGASRSCPGQHLAMFAMLKFIATILLNFRSDIKWDGEDLTTTGFTSRIGHLKGTFWKKEPSNLIDRRVA